MGAAVYKGQINYLFEVVEGRPRGKQAEPIILAVIIRRYCQRVNDIPVINDGDIFPTRSPTNTANEFGPRMSAPQTSIQEVDDIETDSTVGV